MARDGYVPATLNESALRRSNGSSPSGLVPTREEREVRRQLRLHMAVEYAEAVETKYVQDQIAGLYEASLETRLASRENMLGLARAYQTGPQDTIPLAMAEDTFREMDRDVRAATRNGVGKIGDAQDRSLWPEPDNRSWYEKLW